GRVQPAVRGGAGDAGPAADRGGALKRLIHATVSEERDHELQHRGDVATGKPVSELRAPSSPIEALDLVGKNDAGDGETVRDHHLERVALRAARDGTQHRQADFPVLRRRGQYERRTATGLLVAGLRGER